MRAVILTTCPPSLVRAQGTTAAIVFTCLGASYGTAKSGVGISAMGVLRPDLLIKCIVPVVMAGIIAIYGLVVSVLISGDIKSPMTLYAGFIQLGAGLSVGLSGLAAGFAIGVVGDAGVRGTAQQPRLFIGMVSSTWRRIIEPKCRRGNDLTPLSLFRRADSHFDFRRSSGAVRSHHCAHPQHQGPGRSGLLSGGAAHTYILPSSRLTHNVRVRLHALFTCSDGLGRP